MTARDPEDKALFARLRETWDEQDPIPQGLTDRMIAAVAMEDFAREWALLSLVEDSALAAVRGESTVSQLQFSDGITTVLLHIASTEDDRRRVDGWVDSLALEIRLCQGDKDWTAKPSGTGRFAFGSLPPGVSRLRMVVRRPDGSLRDFETPQFEV